MRIVTMLKNKTNCEFINYSAQFNEDHSDCTKLGHTFPYEMLASCTSTHLHIQTGLNHPPPHLCLKSDHPSSYTFNSKRYGLSLFRQDSTIICHVHLKTTNPIVMTRSLYEVFKGLRALRIPVDFEITTDATDQKNVELVSKCLDLSLKEIQPFAKENPICEVPVSIKEAKMACIRHKDCNCPLCSEPINMDLYKDPVCLFKGDIQTKTIQKCLIGESPLTDLEYTQIAISALTGTESVDDIDFQDQLDPLGLVDEDDLHEFLNAVPDGDPPKTNPTSNEWRKIIDSSTVPQEVRPQFEKLMDDNEDLFAYPDTKTRFILDGDKIAVCDIELKTDDPIFIKPYPLAPRMAKVLDSKLDELLSRGEISRVESNYNSPILLTHHNSENKNVAFEQKKFRLCVDLRAINSQMILKNKHSYLVKSIDAMYNKTKDMKFFSKIDMNKAYRSLMCSQKMREICAFKTPYSIKYPLDTFSFNSISDGVATAPGIYSYYLQKALTPKSRECLITHLDDLLICSRTAEEHLQHMKLVFADLLKANFMISISKLQVFKNEVLFLGHIINGQEIKIPEDRKSYFDSLQPPTTKKQMQSLLGVANYMSTFVDSYHLKTGPLFEALRNKDQKANISLNELQMKSFKELKLSIKDAPSLSIIDFDKTLFM